MRLGVAPSGRRSAADAVRLARLVEDSGLDEVWVSEDYTERGAFAVTGAMAAVTSRISVGVGVINPWTRHVVLTAMEAHALDEVAEGRSILGLGASNERWMRGRLGIAFERPAPVLAEYTRILRRLLAGEHVRERILGNLVDTALDAGPSRNIPLIWGVKGPRALALAGSEADGVMLSVLSSPAYVRWVRETVKPASITAYASFTTAPTRAEARERLRQHTAQFLGMHGHSEITTRAGISEETAQELRARLLLGQTATDLVDDEMIGAVTLSGTREDAATAMVAMRDAGVDSLVIIDDGSASPEDLVQSFTGAAIAAGLHS